MATKRVKSEGVFSVPSDKPTIIVQHGKLVLMPYIWLMCQAVKQIWECPGCTDATG